MSLDRLCSIAAESSEEDASDNMEEFVSSLCASKQIKDLISNAILLADPEPYCFIDKDEKERLIIRYGVWLSGVEGCGGPVTLKAKSMSMYEFLADDFTEGHLDNLVNGLAEIDDECREEIQNLKNEILKIVEFLDRALR